MPSALAYAEEAEPYGFAKGVRKACEAALNKRDPKGAKARRMNSSSSRGQIGTIRQAPEILLTEELHRRVRAKKRREYRRIWMSNRRSSVN